MLPRFRLRTLLIIVISFALYLGAYCATLEPMIIVDVGSRGMVIKGSREPHYRLLNGFSRIAFAPLEWIDYKLRPEFWDHYADDLPMPSSTELRGWPRGIDF